MFKKLEAQPVMEARDGLIHAIVADVDPLTGQPVTDTAYTFTPEFALEHARRLRQAARDAFLQRGARGSARVVPLKPIH